MRVHKVDRTYWLFCLAAVLLAGCPPPPELQLKPTYAYADAHWRLLQDVDDLDPEVRMHALEALASVEPKAARGIILQVLKGDRLPVVSAAVLAAGDIGFVEAKEQLLAMAGREDPEIPPKLMCALIYALHRLGDDTYTSELGRMLHHQDAQVRAEAARIMGEMGVPSGVEPLKSRQHVERDLAVQLSIAKALALLKDERSQRRLEGFTKDQYLESRLIAIEGLGRLPHPRSQRVLKNIMKSSEQDPLVRVAAARSLAKLGDASGYARAMAALKRPRSVLAKARGAEAEIREVEVTRLQTQAALALGQMDKKLAVDALHPLLTSDRGQVRIASALAIMQLLHRYRHDAMATTDRARPPGQQPPATQPQTKPALLPPKLHTSGGKD